MNITNSVNIIGGGLAGSEAAWQLANFNIPVTIHEMRPDKMTDVHKTENFSELVCSNSFRSDDYDNNAVGLLHQELRINKSLIMHCADQSKIPAGGALAVDRHKFSSLVSEKIINNNLITIEREEVMDLSCFSNENIILISTGPLTSESLANEIILNTGQNSLAFFDAIAPIVYFDSIDMSKAWFQSRYDKGDGDDYINCPMSQLEYDQFVSDLIEGQKVSFHEWEENTPYFEGCLPIEVLAERGHKTLAFGPLKPVGLTNPNNPNIKPGIKPPTR